MCISAIVCSNLLVSYLLVMFFATVVAILFTWPLIIRTILENWRVIIAIIIPNLVNIVIKKVITMNVFTTKSPPYGDRIVHRRMFMLYDLSQAYLSMFTGIANAIVRMVTAVVLAVVSVPRMDRSAMPEWVTRYLSIDKGLHAFNGTDEGTRSTCRLRVLCVRQTHGHADTQTH